MNTTSEKGTDQTHELTFRRQRHNKERGLSRRSITWIEHLNYFFLRDGDI